jgi:two-component system cell cycle sensor histidine kinase/response regulator CckA
MPQRPSDPQTVRISNILILASLGTYLMVAVIGVNMHDWTLVTTMCSGAVALALPFWMLRSGHFRSGNLVLMVIILATITTIATVGQGIRDLAVVAFPVVFIYAGLTSDRVILRLCTGFTLAAVLWLALGESFGWFVPVPLFRDPFNLFYLSTLAVLLIVTALAVDLLSSNLRRSLDQARLEISQRKSAEHLLEESEKRFGILFQLHTAAQLIIEPGTGRILDANRAAADFYGWSVEDLTGMTILQINALPPDAVKEAMGKAVSNEQVKFEFRHRLADGSIRDVEVYTSRIDVAGKAVLYSIIHDVTERKKAEELLRQGEERYRLMFESAPLAINITRGTEIIYANPAYLDLFGLSSLEELKEFPPLDLFAPEWRDQVRENIQRRARGLPVPSSYEVESLRKDGTRFPIIMYLTNAHFAEGPATVAFIVDITARKQAEDALRHAQKMETVGQLAGGVAHDFNNMLQVITSYTEMSLAEMDAGQPVHEYLSQVLRAARHSAEITGQLLAFARKQTVSPKVLDLNAALAGSRMMIQRLMGEDISLALLPGRDLWTIRMDRTQLDQVLANLAANARDAIAGVGNAAIETRNVTFDEQYCAFHPGCLPGDFVMLAVTDNGRGMDKETLSHLFEPFYTTKETGKGTGLGLSTIYGIVKQNSGFINVSSEPGRGTTFRLYMPRADGGSDMAQRFSEAVPLPRGIETVLIVDDEPAILELARVSLTHLGYEVIAAGSPDEAIRMSAERAGPIQLLVTDVVMPRMNGRELAERLLAQRPGLRCLHMSGYAADVIANRGALEEGMNFIAKPFTIRQLAAQVREVLDR